MPKALVIGGSSGIGLSVSRTLISKGYSVKVLGIHKPDNTSDCEYDYCDLRYPDISQLEALARDEDINTLFISSGIGRVADFQHFSTPEIDKTLTIDTVSVIKILRIFYDKLLTWGGGINFFCGVMSSITGLISSPSAALYVAAKAALCRFIESVNIELESSGTPNRILNIAPGFISGTKFYDPSLPNDPSRNLDLAGQIIDHMLNHDTLFIPKYEETYKGVIERYAKDPHAFGLSSYEYKHRSGRINSKRTATLGRICTTANYSWAATTKALNASNGMRRYFQIRESR